MSKIPFEEPKQPRPLDFKFHPLQSENMLESRYTQQALRASLGVQGEEESHYYGGGSETLAAGIDHNVSLSEGETLVLQSEAQEFLQKSKQFRQENQTLLQMESNELQPPSSELSRRVQEPITGGEKKLSKRSLELFNLRSQEFSVEQKIKKTTKMQEKVTRGEKKKEKAKKLSPIYFFQPSQQKRSEPSEDRAESRGGSRNRARSQEMETLLKGFENILLQEEEKSLDSPSHDKGRKLGIGNKEQGEVRAKGGLTSFQSPIKEDPLEMRQTISRVESEDGLCFKAMLSDAHSEEGREHERPSTPDNTPLTSEFDKFGSPQFFKNRSDAQRRKVRGFFRNPSRSSSTSKLPFEADSKHSSDQVTQNEESRRPTAAKFEKLKKSKVQDSREETKEHPKVWQVGRTNEEGTGRDHGISESLLALQKQKQRILLKPTYFNVMVVGESGIGKTTFIEQFIRKFSQLPFKIYDGDDHTAQDMKVNRSPTTQFREYTRSREQGQISMNLSLIDSPGYGKETDTRKWLKQIKGEIKQRMNTFRLFKHDQGSQVLKKSLSFINRELPDPRIHLCLYFLNGHHIKQADLDFLKALSSYVNILPIIAKADSFTTQELIEVKQSLLAEADRLKIPFFDCLSAVEMIRNDRPHEVLKSNLGPCPPFSVIGATEYYRVQNRAPLVLGRRYPWGFCEAENANHSDFMLLYHVLINYLCISCIGSTEQYYRKYVQRLKQKKDGQQRSVNQLKNAARMTFFSAGVLGAVSFFLSKYKQ